MNTPINSSSTSFLRRQTKPKKIVLGIDPGLGRMGYAVLAGTLSQPKILTVGCLETSSKLVHGQRLVALSSGVQKILRQYKPTIIAIEKLYFSKNVKTALQVAEARGAIMLELTQGKCPIVELSPQAVKLAATGVGNADKLMVQKMLKLIFKLKQVPKPDDAADALAVALCGLSQIK
ncbi:MAG: Crossover junction endodeoxyribonuclease RuvC [Parcubacteria group bacterium GW2011_GWD2_43_10]|nr:MAG: Crossover junction endodeoxyribonuclease RuvC [Parcubacteria group bacterium GW2011_GWA2_42_80]KKS83500.1 MAG: Crossover junction endodeoxyribonuclease RuvC [Parcubacteria group bacterium GW2011_GWD2_43_10]KKT15815.1 MAG: Crossover junction endodeoxyribonuclease RuvC [Parcubacteria group bacterium GW2011_GWF2_43_38]KKT27848.1 MAG: Crossover junction endodeoxyribonuclease RuvC [Parcubacteria group bacterium GW2011_GWF1_43_9]HAO81227.1 crossover junction endodeoxyribonuclease RuvC [Candid